MADKPNVIPARERSIDALVKLYDHVQNSPVSKVDPVGRERDVKDPFGFNEPTADSRDAAKEVTVRLVKFFMLACEEWSLDTEGMLFAAELAALNILNARNMPLSKERAEAVRKEAFDYYTEALKQIPDPPKQALPRR